ncbi:MAG: hypothetical protein LBD35_05080 [Prevotellaceae bacterium]|jgi:hypothetical protein|nr:hypothetical protein [Prevotellaceae bacterium]
MADKLFPETIAGFTEHMKIAHSKMQANLSAYGIDPAKFEAITSLYETYSEKAAVAANPDTATTGARRARDAARDALEHGWRKFLNEYVRYNSAVPIEDFEVFRIKPRDYTPTRVGVPDTVPVLSIKEVGTRRYEIEIFDGKIGGKKKPKHAAGSYIYVAITEPGTAPAHQDEYRKTDYSSTCRHVLEFPLEQLAKQANIYARYSNSHGKEGPESVVETIIIG